VVIRFILVSGEEMWEKKGGERGDGVEGREIYGNFTDGAKLSVMWTFC